jgi:hypothetical protein
LGRPGECARGIHHGRFIAGAKRSDGMPFASLYAMVVHRQVRRSLSWTLA